MKAFVLCTLIASTAGADPKHTAADCEPAVTKMWPVVQEMAKAANHPLKDSDRAEFVSECKKAIAKDPNDPALTCVLAAKDTPAVRACLTSATKDYADKSKKTEALLQLNKLGKNAKVFFITNAMYPKGTAKQLPEKACCPQSGHHCAVTQAWAKDATWEALDFQIDDANLFQYTYESKDGLTFHATATGDVSCDGHTVTYKLDGSAKDGNPIVNLTEPK